MQKQFARRPAGRQALPGCLTCRGLQPGRARSRALWLGLDRRCRMEQVRIALGKGKTARKHGRMPGERPQDFARRLICQ